MPCLKDDFVQALTQTAIGIRIDREDVPEAGLRAVTSPDVLHRDCMAAS
ncbi:MAG: hypothetical protein AAFO74_01415 [Pseudomonadota bacterium]